MSNSIESQGVKFAYSDGGSPSSFTDVGNVVSINGPGGSPTVIDVSNLDSIAREKRMGLPDEGQVTLELNLDPDLASQMALKTARINRTRLEFRITLTDTATTTKLVFFGYVAGFAVGIAVDTAVKASVTIEVDGAVSWT